MIKTGLRSINVAYSKISLKDICAKLGLESEEDAAGICSKAIVDGVIHATVEYDEKQNPPLPLGPADPSAVIQFRWRAVSRTKWPPLFCVSYHCEDHFPSTSNPTILVLLTAI